MNSIKEIQLDIQKIIDEKYNNIEELSDNLKEQLTEDIKKDKDLEILLKDLSIALNEQLNQQYIKKYNNIDIKVEENININDYIYLHDDLKHYSKKSESESIQDWLLLQCDKGMLYNELYDRIVNKKKLKEKENLKNKLENEIENILMASFTNIQKKLYNEALQLIYEYNTYKVKTARVKEKMKTIINIFSLLYKDVNLKIHEYISKKFNIIIVINSNIKDECVNEMDNVFNMYFDQYKLVVDDINNEIKYLKNISKNILSNYKKVIESSSSEEIEYTGMYFKKWSDLKTVEKLERIEAYTKYYISTKIAKNIKKYNGDLYCNIDQSNLYSMLKTALDSKKLTFHDIKWNINKGIIDYISFESTPHSEMSDGSFKLKEKSLTKKTISIFNKKNEEIINKTILSFILKNKSNVDILNNKYKLECNELIKETINIKKIQKNDLTNLSSKYENIYKIVSENSQEV